MKKTNTKENNEIIEIPAEEAPYALPDGWKWVRLLSTFNNETDSKKKIQTKDYLPNGKIPVIDQGQNLIGGYTNEESFMNLSELPVIIFGDHTRCVKYIDFQFVQGADGIKILKPKSDILPKFLFWGLKNLSIPDLGYRRHFPLFPQFVFPLPPLETQQRIVDRIESLFAKLDEAKEKAQTALDTFELRKSAILHKAFTGELTAQWRSSCRPSDISSAPAHIESAPADISSSAPAEHIDNDASITAEHFVNISSVPNSLSPKQSYSGPAEQALPNSSLPNGWLKKCFADVANIKLNLVEPSDYPNYPHIAPDSIEKKTGVLLTYRTVAEDKVTSAKHRFYPGQILYSKIRPYLSKVVIIDFDGLCSADMYPIEAVENTRFLWYYMLSDEFLNQASNAGSRTVLPKINQKELAKISVSLPPLPEQQEIVRILDDLLAKENAAKEAAEAVVEEIDLMKKSILARAFRGEL